jgi:hypothetical protein
VTIRNDVAGPLDWIQVFVMTKVDLAAVAPQLKAAIAPDGLVWISHPKGASKMQADLTRDKGWEPREIADLMWLSLGLGGRHVVGLRPAPVQARRGAPDVPLTAPVSLLDALLARLSVNLTRILQIPQRGPWSTRGSSAECI